MGVDDNKYQLRTQTLIGRAHPEGTDLCSMSSGVINVRR